MNTQLFQGDCLDIVRNLDADSIHCQNHGENQSLTRMWVFQLNFGKLQALVRLGKGSVRPLLRQR